MTRRLADYEVISNLVAVRVAVGRPPRVLRWALRRTFRAEDLHGYFRSARGIQCRRTAVDILRARPWNSSTRAECADALAREMRECQELDIAYWRPIIDDLKGLRRSAKLIAEGTRVEDLL
jgi:hypothetical protein